MLTLQRRHGVERASSHFARMRPNLPVLIQVPEIEPRSHRSGVRRPSTTHFRTKKRRLRREVKLVGLGLLLGIPLSGLIFAPLASWANHVSESAEASANAEAGSSIPSFSVSVEPISSSSSVSASSSSFIETIPNITLQGFVLPDREVEESNHAGG